MQAFRVVEVWKDQDFRAMHSLKEEAGRTLRKFWSAGCGILCFNKRGTMSRLYTPNEECISYWDKDGVDVAKVEQVMKEDGLSIRVDVKEEKPKKKRRKRQA